VSYRASVRRFEDHYGDMSGEGIIRLEIDIATGLATAMCRPLEGDDGKED
jgi:hypothetical protein